MRIWQTGPDPCHDAKWRPITGSRPEALGTFRAALGEGPVWRTENGTVLWIDIRGAALLETDPRKGRTGVVALTEAPGAVALTKAGALLAMGQALVLDGREIARLPSGLPGRFNDRKPDLAGRFWIGTANALGRAECALWCFDGRFVQALAGITMSNGLGWSSDGRCLYHVDTGTLSLDALDCAPDGTLSNRRSLLRLPAGQLPAGLTVDAEGRVWLALWGRVLVCCA